MEVNKSSNSKFFIGVLVGFLIPCLIIVGTLAFNVHGLGDLAKSLFLVEKQGYYELTADKKVEGLISGLLDEIGDPYSYYLDEKELQSLISDLNGTYTGLGMYMYTDDKGKVRVMSVMKDTPAERGGIKVGDRFVSINGKSADDLTANDISNEITGGKNDDITLVMERNGEELTFNLTREEIVADTVSTQVLDKEKGIGYISVSSFGAETAKEFEEAIADLKAGGNLKGLIIDLRNNGGGLVTAAVQMASVFLKEGETIYWESSKRNLTEVTSINKGKVLDIPVVLLVNENSASASEIFAGCLKEQNVATLVGTKTFGKGIIQNVFRLGKGGAVKLTVAGYLTPKKNDIHGVGIKPDVKVKLNSKSYAVIYEVDPTADNQLKAALSLFN